MSIIADGASLLSGIQWEAIWATAATGFIAVQHIRKRLSKDSVEMRSDAALNSLIETLRVEKNKALADLEEARRREDNAWIARNEDAKLIGRMSVQVEKLAEMNDLLQKQVASLRKDVHTMRDALAVFQGAAMLKLLKDGYDPNDPEAVKIVEMVNGAIPDLTCDVTGSGCPPKAACTINNQRGAANGV